MSDRHLAARVILMPKDTNHHGTIFGGVILSHIDLAGAVEARTHTPHKVVTVAMQGVEFLEPVHVGDVVSFYTSCLKVGNSSIRVKVDVEAQRNFDPLGEVIHVTEAEVVYVAVDAQGKKTKI